MESPITARFSHYAQTEPAVVAVVDTLGRAWSRQQLFESSNRLSRALRSCGLKPGDVIALFAPNCGEYLQAYLAATQIGLYVVSINSHLARSEAAHILCDSGARVLFAHERLSALAKGVIGAAAARPSVLISFGQIEGFTQLDEVCAPHSGAALEHPVMGRVLTYTSATTGRPKGVELPLADAEAATDRVIRAHIANGIRLEDCNVHLCASMLYHPAPLEWSALALHMGHKVVLVDNWNPELLLRLIEEHSVTTTFMVPAMFVRMLKLPI